MPTAAVRADVRLYYQSTSKEFMEFLRDENTTDTQGQEMYDFWVANDKCPPVLMASKTWVTAYALKSVHLTGTGAFLLEFYSRPGVDYTIEYKDALTDPTWQTFTANGSLTATNTVSEFEDDFTGVSSGGPSSTGARFYRVGYLMP